jgi:hypothetical protein
VVLVLWGREVMGMVVSLVMNLLLGVIFGILYLNQVSKASV